MTTRRKVLLVGIDGLRVDDALRPGAAPALAALVDAGTTATMRMEVPTWSGPGWTSLLTGTTHREHRVLDNTFRDHAIVDGGDLLSRAAAADPTCTTFAAAGWPPITDPAGPGPVIAARPEDARTGRHRVIVRDGELYGYRWADGEVAAAAVLALREAGPDVAFVYLGEVDEAGHLHGGRSAEYAAALLRVDAHLARIVAAVERRVAEGADEDWLVAVTTDHGHVDAGGHGGDEDVVTRSFLALRRIGREARPTPAPQELGPQDVAGVLLAHLDGP